MAHRLMKIDIFVDDVLECARLLSEAYDFELVFAESGYAELTSGELVIMVSTEARIPVPKTSGIVLHVEVDDLSAAVDRARAAGAQVLRSQEQTPWGTTSALMEGPAGIIVDLYANASV